MKAIQTEYAGILFRSRLEARWAVLFDAMNVEWQYEPECFELKSGKKYTPDFYLKDYKLLVEIKPDIEVVKDSYHMGRYRELEAPLLLLMGDYPNFNTNLLINKPGPEEVIFIPTHPKYAPFWWSGQELGMPETLFEGEFDQFIDVVKQHRFWN